METPTYYKWNSKKKALVSVNESGEKINLKEQIPRPVVYAKLILTTAPILIRKKVKEAPTITVYLGIVHTSPSMPAFAGYVGNIIKEHEEVLAYVKKEGATAIFLGDYYAEKGAKRVLKGQEGTPLPPVLPEFPSNINPAKYGFSLGQRADQLFVPTESTEHDETAMNLENPIDREATALEDDNLKAEVRSRARKMAAGNEKYNALEEELDTAAEEEIRSWRRDTKIDHSPVLLNVDIIVDIIENKDGKAVQATIRSCTPKEADKTTGQQGKRGKPQ